MELERERECAARETEKEKSVCEWCAFMVERERESFLIASAKQKKKRYISSHTIWGRVNGLT